jgi:hypothetical protein
MTFFPCVENKNSSRHGAVDFWHHRKRGKHDRFHKVTLWPTHQYSQERFWPLKVQLDTIGEMILPVFNTSPKLADKLVLRGQTGFKLVVVLQNITFLKS